VGETIEVSCLNHHLNRQIPHSVPHHWAVSFYRSNFADCPAGAVANSYPKPDLLWDNVVAGPWERPAKVSNSQLPAPRFADTAGRANLQNARADDPSTNSLRRVLVGLIVGKWVKA
jgi:hypothetical protein